MNESDFKNQEVKNYLVKNFIEHNLLLQEAQRRNIKVDEKKISAVTESFLSEAGTQDLKVYSGSYDTDAKALSEILFWHQYFLHFFPFQKNCTLL